MKTSRAAARLLSMPWWSWIVIWIALVALSLLFFVVLGVRLFRQFMATVKELGAAGERFSAFPSAPGPPTARRTGGSDGPRTAARRRTRIRRFCLAGPDAA